ncbi:MAG TPA: YihY/virulence factor BrkB family protein [Euzebyales bacterium]|nr:YihY/virulence factor BrkB family protein [Euzebyales bacterium]
MSDTTRQHHDDRGREADRPGEIPSRGFLDVGKRVLAEIKEDNIPVVAAGCAFYAWVALIPALIALIMIYGLVASEATVQQQITRATQSMSQDVARVISDPIMSATGMNRLGLGALIALAGVLWSASGGVDGLIKGINIAYDEEPRSFPRRRGLAILLTFGAIVFLIVAIGLIGVVPVLLEQIAPGPIARIGGQVASFVLLAALMMVALGVLYKIAPHRDDPKIRWVSWGAVIATVLWVIGSVGFFFFVNNFGSYNETYGALAGVIVLNLWLLLTMFVILLGAEINSELEHQTRRDTTTGNPRPMGQRDAKKADHVGEAATGKE